MLPDLFVCQWLLGIDPDGLSVKVGVVSSRRHRGASAVVLLALQLNVLSVDNCVHGEHLVLRSGTYCDPDQSATLILVLSGICCHYRYLNLFLGFGEPGLAAFRLQP